MLLKSRASPPSRRVMTATPRGNAVPPASPIVGRAADLASIAGLIADGVRVVTIAGPGGIGKTRLVRELLARQADAFSAHGGGGAWFVDTSQAQSLPELCAQLAAVLQLRTLGRDPVAAIGRALRRMQRVLIGLDNLEQLGGDARTALAAWTEAAPTAQFLATTRVAFGLVGQHVWSLAPLPVPTAGASVDAVTASDAWQLFIARLRAIHPDVRLDAQLTADVAEIVRRIDGVPLAIELAAARAKVLTPAQILERLRDPLALLVRAQDDGRHGSMRRTIVDSIAMLPAWAQPCVAALGAFAGIVELDAMASALAPLGVDAAAALEVLCDHGLIVRALERGTWTGRFVVFEPVRQLAGELADQQGTASAFSVAHARWYAGWARELTPAWATDSDAAHTQVARHLDNALAALRVAIGFAALFGEAVQLAIAIDPHLALHGQHRRRVDLLGAVLGAPLDAPLDVAIEAELRLARGSALRELGELEAAAADWAWIEARAAAVGVRIAALATARRSELVEIDGRTDEAQAMLRRTIGVLAEARGPAERIAEAELHARLGHALRRDGTLDEASAELGRARALFAHCRQREGVAAMLYEAAVIALFRGELDAAERGFDEVIALATELGARIQAAAARLALGILAQARGQLDRAIGMHAEAANAFRDLGQLHREGSALYSLASAYLERGDVPQALLVHAQAVACIDAVGAARYQALLAALAALAHVRLGDEPSARAACAVAEAAAARCRRESPLRAVLDIVQLRLGESGELSTDRARAARAIADAIPGDDPQLFARLVAIGRTRAGSSPMRGLSIAGNGEAYLDGTSLELARRLPLRRILAALAAHRSAAPGEALSLDALVAAGWPGEKIRPDAAINRIHVALSTLRRLGLRDVIVSGEHGYLIDPAVVVEIA